MPKIKVGGKTVHLPYTKKGRKKAKEHKAKMAPAYESVDAIRERIAKLTEHQFSKVGASGGVRRSSEARFGIATSRERAEAVETPPARRTRRQKRVARGSKAADDSMRAIIGVKEEQLPYSEKPQAGHVDRFGKPWSQASINAAE